MMTCRAQGGTLEVICGPMFAGKTTELLRRVERATATGARVAVLRPAQDTRSARHAVETHAGERHVAIEVTHAAQVVACAGDAAVVAIDEAHFLGEALLPACRTLLDRGRRVIVAGVDTDHRGDAFEPFPGLLAAAHQVTRLQGTCARCGAPSTHTQRLVALSARIVVGGAEHYEPRCTACFEPGRAA